MSSRVDLRDHLNQYSSSFSNSNFIPGVRSKHGALNKETELNLRSIFSILIPYFIYLPNDSLSRKSKARSYFHWVHC